MSVAICCLMPRSMDVNYLGHGDLHHHNRVVSFVAFLICVFALWGINR